MDDGVHCYLELTKGVILLRHLGGREEKETGQVQWLTSVVSATLEAEAGGWLEFRRLRLQ